MMRVLFLSVVSSLVLVVACSSENESAPAASEPPSPEPTAEAPPVAEEEPAAEQEGPQPLRVADDGSQIYGAELSDELEAVTLASVLESPADFDGQIVKTEGEISAVCERMGCWMELRADDGQAVRVPMAGHGFFLPQSVSGHRATVEGRVQVSELDPATIEHLESEGAEAARASVGIEATSVVVQPAT